MGPSPGAGVAPSNTNTLNVLVVDHNNSSRHGTVDLLRENGYNVRKNWTRHFFFVQNFALLESRMRTALKLYNFRSFVINSVVSITL